MTSLDSAILTTLATYVFCHMYFPTLHLFRCCLLCSRRHWPHYVGSCLSVCPSVCLPHNSKNVEKSKLHRVTGFAIFSSIRQMLELEFTAQCTVRRMAAQ